VQKTPTASSSALGIGDGNQGSDYFLSVTTELVTCCENENPLESCWLLVYPSSTSCGNRNISHAIAIRFLFRWLPSFPNAWFI